jgi:hypothetical protein
MTGGSPLRQLYGSGGPWEDAFGYSRAILGGLGVETRRGSLPPPPHQGLLQTKVPHIPGMSALLQQEHFLCSARIQAEPHGTQRSAGPRRPCGNQTPLGVVVPSSMISGFTWWSSPRIGAACSTRKCSNGANTSGRRCARSSTRPLPSPTENKTKSTCSSSTCRRWRSPRWSTPSRVSRGGGCGRTSLAGLTERGWGVVSGPRRTSPDRVVARRSPSSRTTPPTRDEPATQGFLPDLKDRVSTPDRR